ncbi:MAG: cob(I)yrinic acid a,c-diamide adenosyltransferase [Clostridiales bacterium]|nr:cob(I)yrinic acid a,c-diamide adenosyltransferase [Clostridiales bacterium]
MLEKGYIQVYTGNGKGKTTAALGLALRTVCAGNKVFMGQFMKGQDYSELKAVEYLPCLEIEQFGSPWFISGKPTDEDRANAQNGLEKMKKVLALGSFDIVIMDEINTALYFGLVSAEDVLSALDLKSECTEVILTGRYAPQEIIDRADLVTEMREIKHYYTQGVGSRAGIEN